MGSRAALLVALLASAGMGVFAQDPPAPPQQAPFRSGANVVRVDATVTDRAGEPVRSLTADDFEVLEDGVVKPITSFKLLEANGQPTDDYSLPIRSAEHAAAEAARDDVRVFLIFWDEYHIGEFASSLRAREELKKFVLEAFGPTDLVAFMDPLTTLDGIRFTRDRRALAEHVHRLKGRRGVYIPPRSVLEETHLRETRDIEGIRSQITVGALRGALLHLGALREGRKTLILISESLGPLRDQTAKVMSDLMRTASDTNTAIVTVDPRGLQVGRGPGARPSDNLLALAYASGADPIVTNDLAAPLRRIVRQASASYLLGYDGSGLAMDGRFHQIKVRVKRGGLEVRARAGYWAPRASEIARARQTAAAAALPPAVARAFQEMPAEVARRPVDVWVGVGPGDVTVAWTPRAAFSSRTAASVDVEATTSGAAVHTGDVPAHGVTFTAPAGELALTLTVRDVEGEIIDRQQRSVSVPLPSAAALALSTPIVFRARTPLELRSFEEAAPPVHAGRDFERGDRLRVRVQLYGTDVAGAEVSARLLGARGASLAALPIAGTSTPGRYELDLAPSSISRGQFVIAIHARKGSERAEALVPFRVR